MPVGYPCTGGNATMIDGSHEGRNLIYHLVKEYSKITVWAVETDHKGEMSLFQSNTKLNICDHNYLMGMNGEQKRY